jgi:hypothetical protein
MIGKCLRNQGHTAKPPSLLSGMISRDALQPTLLNETRAKGAFWKAVRGNCGARGAKNHCARDAFFSCLIGVKGCRIKT